MIHRRSIVAPLTLACLAVAAAVFAATDLSGTWVGKTEVQNRGTDEVTLLLKLADNAYTGTIGDSQGHIAKDTQIKNVKLDGATLSFSFPLANGDTITVTLTVAEDKMAGQWKDAAGPTGDIVLEKKK